MLRKQFNRQPSPVLQLLHRRFQTFGCASPSLIIKNQFELLVFKSIVKLILFIQSSSIPPHQLLQKGDPLSIDLHLLSTESHRLAILIGCSAIAQTERSFLQFIPCNTIHPHGHVLHSQLCPLSLSEANPF